MFSNKREIRMAYRAGKNIPLKLSTKLKSIINILTFIQLNSE